MKVDLVNKLDLIFIIQEFSFGNFFESWNTKDNRD